MLKAGGFSRQRLQHRWFTQQGVPLHELQPVARPPPSPSCKRRLQRGLPPKPQGPSAKAALAARTRGPVSDLLLLFDFDCTITDYDAGERLVGELAPELAPLLASLEMPANFVPTTNSILSEMARRGIPRDRIVTLLHTMGREIPPASVKMLQWAFKQGVEVRILSDCNSVFISHMLTGAKVNTLVRQVITNFSSFETVDPHQDLSEEAWGAAKPAAHRLVITPRHDERGGSHGCPLCPANLCKGQELEALRAAHPYRAIVYAGDGANDLCPSLALSPSDVVLARKGCALERLILARQGEEDEGKRVVARVLYWENHAQLFEMVQHIVR